jgi:hypothetical protein
MLQAELREQQEALQRDRQTFADQQAELATHLRELEGAHAHIRDEQSALAADREALEATAQETFSLQVCAPNQ